MDLKIDASELAAFGIQCKEASKVLERQFNKELIASGEIVARKARQNASFSSRIPASIKTRRRGTRVRVVAGGDKAPHAAPLENHGQTGSFRHPVFGNYDNWVDQPAHPFLTPAAEESMDDVVAAVLKAVVVTEAAMGVGHGF
jgi:hypothetical protein